MIPRLPGGAWRLPIVPLIIAVVATLGIPRLNREIAFYDEGIYVVNGKSLASGAGYRNLSLPDEPPQGKYPPLAAWLLGLVWWAWPHFPSNLLVMKALVLAMGLLLLVVADWYLRNVLRFSRLESGLVVAVTGLNPLFLSSATLATSDIPFALLSLSAIAVYERPGHRSPVAWGLALGLAVLAFLTRTAGVFLLMALIVHLLLRRRFASAVVAGGVSAVAIGGWLGWSRWASAAYAAYPPDVRANYVGYAASATSDWMQQLPAVFALNLKLLVYTWTFFVTPWAPLVLAPLILLPAGLFLIRGSRRIGAAELYCALYVGALLVVPYPDTARYFLPVAPLLIAYVVGWLRRPRWNASERGEVLEHPPSRWRWVLPVVAAATLVTDLASASPGKEPAARRQYAELHRMLSWISEHVPSDAVVVGAYDPAYYLFTGRKAIRLAVQDNFKVYYTDTVATEFPQAPELLEAFGRMRACYLIRDPMIGGPEYDYFGNIIEAIKRASHSPFEMVYAGGDGLFVVYKRSDCP